MNLSLEMSFTVESTVKIMRSQPRKIPSGIVTVSTQSVHNSSPAVRSQRCPDCIRNPADVFNIMRKTLAWKTAFSTVIVASFFLVVRLHLVLYFCHSSISVEKKTICFFSAVPLGVI